MDTEILLPNKNTYNKCAKILANDELVAFPTETVYGLGANAFSTIAIEKIFKAKGRPNDNPLIVHTYNIDGIKDIAKEITPTAEKLINAFMPGPITIVLEKKDSINEIITAGLNTVGIRIPQNKVAIEFLKACAFPIAAPSANSSTRPSPTQAEHVFEDLKGKIPAIIDGGKCEIGIESTVVDATGDIPAILRPGKITAEDIKRVCGNVKNDNSKGVIRSPGVKYRHYAPKCECILIKSNNAKFIENVFNNQKLNGKKTVLLCYQNIANKLNIANVINIGKDDTEASYNLFRFLRQAEKEYDLILLQSCSNIGIGQSLYNRMIKSCGGNVINEN